MKDLKLMTSKRQYSEVIKLLEAVLQLSEFFNSFESIKRIDEIKDEILSIRRDLKRQIFDQFDASFTSQGILTSDKEQLASGAIIIDILGGEQKSQLCNWYSDLLLKEYRAIFRGNSDIATLDSVSRRFSWLNRLIKNYEENHSQIFPSSWKMGEFLAERFCVDTK